MTAKWTLKVEEELARPAVFRGLGNTPGSPSDRRGCGLFSALSSFLGHQAVGSGARGERVVIRDTWGTTVRIKLHPQGGGEPAKGFKWGSGIFSCLI